MIFRCGYKTPDGFDDLVMESDGEVLTGLWFEGGRGAARSAADSDGGIAPAPDIRAFHDTRRWLDAYFSGQLPDFSGLGYTAEKELVNLGMQFDELIPVWFDGVYTRGETRFRWTVSTAADKDAWAACLGRPHEISENKVKTALSQKNSFNVFFDFNGYQKTPAYMATLVLEQGTSDDAWELIQSLQEGAVPVQ